MAQPVQPLGHHGPVADPAAVIAARARLQDRPLARHQHMGQRGLHHRLHRSGGGRQGDVEPVQLLAPAGGGLGLTRREEGGGVVRALGVGEIQMAPGQRRHEAEGSRLARRQRHVIDEGARGQAGRVHHGPATGAARGQNLRIRSRVEGRGDIAIRRDDGPDGGAADKRQDAVRLPGHAVDGGHAAGRGQELARPVDLERARGQRQRQGAWAIRGVGQVIAAIDRRRTPPALREGCGLEGPAVAFPRHGGDRQVAAREALGDVHIGPGHHRPLSSTKGSMDGPPRLSSIAPSSPIRPLSPPPSTPTRVQ